MSRTLIGSSTSGGKSTTIVYAITAGSVSTAPIITFDRINTTAIKGLPNISGYTIDLTQTRNDPSLTDFFNSYVTSDTTTTEADTYEDGTIDYPAGATPTLAFATFGGTADGKVQTFFGACKISSTGDMTQEYNKVTKRAMQLVSQKTVAVLTFPTACFPATCVTTPTQKVLNTSIWAGETWM